MVSEGLEIVGTEEMMAEHEEMKNYLTEAEMEETQAKQALFETSLAGHIIYVYTQNKDSRRDSGIEQEMLDGMDAFNGEYEAAIRSAIEQEGGSKIFMNITATKSRNCSSWIKDIMMPAMEKAWRLSPTAEPEIDPKLMETIEGMLMKEFNNFQMETQEAEKQETDAQSQAPQEGPPPPAEGQGAVQQPAQEQKKGPAGSQKLATKLREMNKARRDIEETFEKEVEMIARGEMKRFEKIIEDQLQDGQWEKALGEFIEDFTIYPCAFLKGPIITKEPRVKYIDGTPQVSEEIVFMNKRISPLDMYPSANATETNQGTLIEHVRYERSELANLVGLPADAGYNEANIQKVLETYQGADFTSWLWTDIESDKAYAEKRGNEFQANRNIIHGLHFFGKASVSMLKDWGMPGLDDVHDTDEVEIDAILVDNVVIRAVLNSDPLGRRPYYKASFQSRPGSFWGRSLPHLMRDIQRMCNATARALANNMGLASGPQVEIYTDRLADKGDIEDIKPMKIWQLTSDPTGAGGRAVQFTQPTSNAAELLSVYKEFELRADDATGIPRYAYGNERTGGAASTASGLSMLLESASKGIKDAIRHIDDGLIKPRIAYQFYWNMLKDPDLKYTGDINVVPVGSAALTMKAAEQGKRLELMQALSGNPAVMEVVGPEAMAEIFRTLFEDANMPEIMIPSRLEIRTASKEKAEVEAENQKMAMEMEHKRISVGLEATKVQSGGQERMHKETMALKQQELKMKEKESLDKSVSATQALQSSDAQAADRMVVDAERAKAERNQADIMQRREMAMDLTTMSKDEPISGVTER